jgi:hypothetical protein
MFNEQVQIPVCKEKPKIRNPHGIKMDSKVVIPFRWLSKDGKLLLTARILFCLF